VAVDGEGPPQPPPVGAAQTQQTAPIRLEIAWTAPSVANNERGMIANTSSVRVVLSAKFAQRCRSRTRVPQ
jgi:hypothetical protein